jgi:glycosyltransferase involved in cell wall biosynthesis
VSDNSVGAYSDPSKTTSGQRFFACLAKKINARSSNCTEPKILLFNVSASPLEIIRARALGKRVVLRVDGLYFDRLCSQLTNSLGPFARAIVFTVASIPVHGNLAAHAANFFNENWKVFVRMWFAHHIIYQSRYSQKIYEVYFPRKSSSVVVNGADMVFITEKCTPANSPKTIELVSIFDEWKPAKRMVELIEFVTWAKESKKVDIRLTLLGYTGRFGAHAPPGLDERIRQAPFFRLLPRFKEFTGDVAEALLSSDIYITFTYRDPCPNVVVEAMAHGLPVVAVSSGGIPDIVGDAGVLLPANDPGDFFGPSRYEADFPAIDFERVLDAVLTVKGNLASFRERVRKRFDDELSMDNVAARYLAAMRNA